MTAPRRKLVAIDDPLQALAAPPVRPAPRAPNTQATAALFVRLPLQQSERLARAAFELRAHKREIVAALIANYVDATSDDGIAALRALIDGYRESEQAGYPSKRRVGSDS